MLNTPAAIAGAAPGAPARAAVRPVLEGSEAVRRNLGFAFDAVVQNEQPQVATPHIPRGVPVPGAPIRLAVQLMELRVDTDVRRNLEDLFANAEAPAHSANTD